MSLVHHQPRAVALLQCDDLTQRRVIAIHREHALCYHQAARFAGRGLGAGPLELRFKVLQIIVAKHAELRAAEPRGVHDASMHQLIEDDEVLFAQESANGADGGRVAGGEAQGGLHALEGRQRFVQRAVGRERAADQA